MLRAGVGRVQLMPRPHAQMCVEWSVCAAAEPADDVADALHEQKKGASRGREADAACRRPSRAADATATLRCVWNGLCAARCVMCVSQAAAHVLCLVAPEMSGGPSLQCQYGYKCMDMLDEPGVGKTGIAEGPAQRIAVRYTFTIHYTSYDYSTHMHALLCASPLLLVPVYRGKRTLSTHTHALLCASPLLSVWRRALDQPMYG